MADEQLRHNLDRALDPGPDFPPPWLMSRTMVAIAEAARGGRPSRRSLNLRLNPATQRTLAVLLVLAVTAVAVGAFLALHRAVPASPRGTIDIASDEPTQGMDARYGLPEQYGAAFAISRVKTVRGFRLRLVTYDGSVNGVHDPQRAVQNVREMLNDPDLVGLLAGFPSNSAKPQIQVTSGAGLAMVSASNPADCLTLDLPYCQAADGFTPGSLRVGENNYFRIAAADTFQAIATAQFAYDTLGLRKVAVWDDAYSIDAALADTFARSFVRRGGLVVARSTFDTSHGPPAPDFRPWLRAARAAGAEGIYAGAASVTFACVARGQSAGIFAPDSYYFGLSGIGSYPREEGIANSDCIRDAGTMANSYMYSTLGVPDASLNPDAREAIAAYTAAHPKPADLGDYTFAGYDAAMILIDAIRRAIDANGGGRPTRKQVLRQLARTTQFHGTTGVYTFDSNGDPSDPVVAILQNQGGNWPAVKNVAVTNCITC